jgi:hypothetical protein
MHLAGSLPSSQMRMMSGLTLGQRQKTTVQAQSTNSVFAQLAEERFLSQLDLWCSFAEELMSLDGYPRQQLRVCAVCECDFSRMSGEVRSTISEANPEPAGVLGVR